MKYKKRRKNKKVVTEQIHGPISITRRGMGYFSHTDFDEDIEIPHDALNTAQNGDTVLVLPHTHKQGERIRGEVVRVIKRAKTRFVGTLEKKNGVYFLIPDDQRMYAAIQITNIKKKGIPGNIKVLISVTKWNDLKKNPEGTLTKVLGPKGAHEVEMEAIVLERGFDIAFPKEVEAQANRIEKQKKISEHELKKRRDFRNIPTFTIDPTDAKDFDDALSVRKLQNEDTEVGVHIADVSHYVTVGSAIDKEARERGTSIYLVDRTIPMLPEILSNDVCSLREGEDRLTFSAVFVLSKKGEMKSRWFGKTIIHSQKRFTYEEAQQILDQKKGRFYEELHTLKTLADILRTERFKKGSIAFEQDEIGFELDKDGKPLRIYKKKRIPTHLLIEDFMLLANREVAEYFERLSKERKRKTSPFVYRVHNTPDKEKLEELAVFLKAMGYTFDLNKDGTISSKEINNLFKEIRGKPEENLITTAAIRSMAKAVYAVKNIGHFGLAFKYYTHFTSPIRRYPDILVHRILQRHLDGTAVREGELKHYEKLALQSSEREIAAVVAERESVKYKQVEYMQKYVGKIFKGVITGVVDWGIYVEEKETRAEGLVRIRNLSDDFYVLDKTRFALVGKRTKKIYRLGDTVTIKLIAADLETKTLEYIFVK